MLIENDIQLKQYLNHCKKLSITARMAVQLLSFKQYIKIKNISSKYLDDFFEHLWKWPLIKNPDDFQAWEQSKTELIQYGLGEDINLLNLNLNDIDEDMFKTCIESIVENLWGNFWGASDNVYSMRNLESSLNLMNLEELPSLLVFNNSLFKDNEGWGNNITLNELKTWKSSFPTKK